MADTVTLPRLGQGMEAGTIVRWLRSEGDRLQRGEPLYELDTDKVTQEVEAERSGVLLKILVREGAFPVGTPLAWIGDEGEELPMTAGVDVHTGAETRPAGETVGEQVPAAAPKASTGATARRVKASPLARRVARERGIELAALVGTGPDGRIVAEDVERVAGVSPPATGTTAPRPTGERIPLSSLQRTIVRRLTEAWTAPAFQVSMAADTTRAQELRAKLVERHPDERPTITDLLTKLCAVALMRHPAVNALYLGDAVEVCPSANIAIAVATQRGLVVPVIFGCEEKTVAEIAVARAELVARAREGKLQRADLEGGTFTISNLGMFGVEQFTAVLNPPQAAILAIGAGEERPVVRDGQIVVRPMLTMTLTCDHRVLDGATGAEFLRTVKELVEEPALAL